MEKKGFGKAQDRWMDGRKRWGKGPPVWGPGHKERVLNSKIVPRGPWAQDPYLNLPGLDSFYHLPGLAL